MKDRPILFSGEMVRAILDGRKTQTRRLVRIDGSPVRVGKNVLRRQRGIPADASNVRMCGPYLKCDAPAGSDTVSSRVECPYGAPGDRLWVRETFAAFAAEGRPTTPRDARYVVLRDGAQVYADGETHPPLANYAAGAFDDIKWRPSIHMPRWASRITLEVVSVRVERLRAITEEDARAEGVDWVAPHPYGERWDDDREDPREVGYPGGGSFARDNFRRLWDSINGKRAAWAQNPWVWAVEFRMVQP